MTRSEPGERRRRIAAACWLVVAIVVWNGVYDLLLTRAVKEYLLRVAMYEAGRGPLIPVSQVMDYSIYDAVWKSTLAASVILLAGLLTIRYVGQGAR
jgi:hypothetical protein